MFRNAERTLLLGSNQAQNGDIENGLSLSNKQQDLKATINDLKFLQKKEKLTVGFFYGIRILLMLTSFILGLYFIVKQSSLKYKQNKLNKGYQEAWEEKKVTNDSSYGWDASSCTDTGREISHPMFYKCEYIPYDIEYNPDQAWGSLWAGCFAPCIKLFEAFCKSQTEFGGKYKTNYYLGLPISISAAAVLLLRVYNEEIAHYFSRKFNRQASELIAELKEQFPQEQFVGGSIETILEGLEYKSAKLAAEEEVCKQLSGSGLFGAALTDVTRYMSQSLRK